MDPVQHEIEAVQVEIRSAHAAVERAIRERRNSAKDSPLVADRNAAIASAREALAAVELRLRQLYESKSDE